jgi:gas vesicle protein
MSDRIYYSREAEERANRERGMMVLVFLLVGLGIGAALALLFAPKSGEDIREELGKSLEQAADRGSEATQNALKQLEREFREFRKKIEDR